MILYHYTCDHGMKGIRRYNGVIRPNPSFVPSLVWLTDLDVPDRLALGLTSVILDCDRTQHQFRVDGSQPGIEPWTSWCRETGRTRQFRERFEGTPGARPGHWWVSTLAVVGELVS